MATKTTLATVKDVHKKINAAAKVSDYEMLPFDLVVNGPDDRRVDKALDGDAKLSASIAKACQTAADEFVKQAAKALGAAQTEYEKVKADTNAVKRLFSTTFQALETAFAAFEKNAAQGTTKVWKAYVAGHDELRSARFDPVVTQWLPDFKHPETSQRGAAQIDELASKDDMFKLWAECRNQVGMLESELATVCDELRRAVGECATINTLLDDLQKEYDSGARESQKDDDRTDPDEEPDESQLDEAIFNRFEKRIEEANTGVLVGQGALIRAAETSATWGRDLNTVLKGVSHATMKFELAKNVEQVLDGISAGVSDVIKALVAAGSKAKAAQDDFKPSFGVLDALRERKTGALGLLSKAKLSVEIPLKDFEGVHAQVKAVLKKIPG